MKATLETINQARRNPGGWFRYAAVLVAAALLLSVVSVPALAQYGSASISATVVDKTGGVVPNAKVVLNRAASPARR